MIDEQTLYGIVVQMLCDDTEVASGTVSGIPQAHYDSLYSLLSLSHQSELDRLVEATDGWFYIP